MKQSIIAILCFLGHTSTLAAQDADADRVREAVNKGLAWLASKQAKDGSWPAQQQGMPTAHTAFSGLAFLAAGNNLNEGKYAPNLRLALNWYRNQKAKEVIHSGLLGADPSEPGNTGRYMPEHGVAMSFLAQLLEEAKGDDRQALRKLLADGVAFSMKGQSSLGGWFYTSAAEGHDSSENVATMLVVQGLIDARNAGIAVPHASMKKVQAYLERCTTVKGGIIYSGGDRPAPDSGGRPTITAMAVVAYLPKNGPYTDETTRRWLAFCADTPRLAPVRKMSSTDLLTQYFVSRIAFHLNEREWRESFPKRQIPDHLNWSKYRTAVFEHLLREQNADGSWPADGWTMGPLFGTTMALNILLYEHSYRLPLSR